MANNRRFIKQPIQVIPGQPVVWQTGPGETTNDRRAYAIMRTLEDVKAEYNSTGGLEPRRTTTGGVTTTFPSWVNGDFGVGAPPPTDNRLYVQDEAGAGSGQLQKFAFTTVPTANSGLLGLRLQKSSAGTAPLGMTLEYDTGPLWDVGLAATNTDLQIYSHAIPAKVIEMRADTGQMYVARSASQPTLLGQQVTLIAGNAATITGITNANPMVVTVGASHRFALGEGVNFVSIAGALGVTLNGTAANVTAVGATTITFGSVDSTAYAAYSGGGTAYVTMNGIRMTQYGNTRGLALFQGLSSSVTKRVGLNFNNVYQFGTDADQNGTGDLWYFNNATGAFPLYFSPTDKVFLGGGGVAPVPTAKLHIGAGVAAASGAPLKLSSGVLNTVAEVGAMEFASSSLFFVPSGTTRKAVVLAPTAPTAFTQTFATASHTVAAYTPDPESGSYAGLDNLQVGTPYAAVADLNTLRVAYENLRAMTENIQQVLNGVIDDGQAAALFG